MYRADGAINVLDVEAMEIRALTSCDPSSYAVSPDGSLLVCGLRESPEGDRKSAVLPQPGQNNGLL